MNSEPTAIELQVDRVETARKAGEKNPSPENLRAFLSESYALQELITSRGLGGLRAKPEPKTPTRSPETPCPTLPRVFFRQQISNSGSVYGDGDHCYNLETIIQNVTQITRTSWDGSDVTLVYYAGIRNEYRGAIGLKVWEYYLATMAKKEWYEEQERNQEERTT